MAHVWSTKARDLQECKAIHGSPKRESSMNAEQDMAHVWFKKTSD